MDQPATPPTRNDEACLRCGATLELVGTEEFRTGGTTGGWKLVFGEWAELGENLIRLVIRACPTCRTVDLRVPVRVPVP